MFPFPNMMCGAGPGGPQFVGFTKNNTTNFSAYPVGSIAGDIAIAWSGTATGVVPPGFTSISGSQVDTIFSTGGLWNASLRILTTADISAGGVAFNSTGNTDCLIAVFRGPTSASVRLSAGHNSATNYSVGGFTKSATSKWLLIVGAAQNNAMTIATVTAGVSLNIDMRSGLAASYATAMFDLKADQYADLTAINFADWGVNNCWNLLELTGGP